MADSRDAALLLDWQCAVHLRSAHAARHRATTPPARGVLRDDIGSAVRPEMVGRRQMGARGHAALASTKHRRVAGGTGGQVAGALGSLEHRAAHRGAFAHTSNANFPATELHTRTQFTATVASTATQFQATRLDDRDFTGGDPSQGAVSTSAAQAAHVPGAGPGEAGFGGFASRLNTTSPQPPAPWFTRPGVAMGRRGLGGSGAEWWPLVATGKPSDADILCRTPICRRGTHDAERRRCWGRRPANFPRRQTTHTALATRALR
jgi:hypothetical protein